MNTENNKLIAEFLQLEKYSNNEYLVNKMICNKDVLYYHSDWNWLMEVVLKINQFENQRFSCLINSMDCKIHDNERNKFIVDSYGRFTPDELLKSIYTCVVYFIKWYNQQKQ